MTLDPHAPTVPGILLGYVLAALSGALVALLIVAVCSWVGR